MKRKSKRARVCLSLLTLLLFAGFTNIPMAALYSHAETVTRDGIEAEITTPKKDYQSSENITSTINITNRNSAPVKNLSVNEILPDGYALKTGETSFEIPTLAPGKTYSVENQVLVAKDSNKETHESSNQSAEKNESQKASIDNKQNALNSNNSNNNKNRKNILNKIGISPRTGEGRKNLAIFLCTIILFAVVVAYLFFYKKKGKTKAFTSSALIGILVLPMIISPLITNAANEKNVSVETTVYINNDASKIVLSISYPLDAINVEGKDSYTKGQWIKLLMDKIGANYSENTSNHYYSDTEDDDEGRAIEYAQSAGFLPSPELEDADQDVPVFGVNETANREFVAFTAVKASGFIDGYDTSSSESLSDWSTVKYPGEVAKAIQLHYFWPTDNTFGTTSPITKYDVNNIFTTIDSWNSDIEWKDQITDNSIYADNVIKYNKNDLEYSADKNEDGSYLLKIGSDSSKLKEGEVVVLPQNDTYPGGLALKISTVNDDGTYTGVTPDISEVYDCININGSTSVDPNEMVPTDGVTVSYDPNGSLEGESTSDENEVYPLKVGGTAKLPGTLTFKIEKKTPDKHGSISASVKCYVPTVTAKANVTCKPFVKIEDLSFLIGNHWDAKVSGKVEGNTADTRAEIQRFKGIPLGHTGLTIGLVLYLDWNISGEITGFEFEPDFSCGIQYNNGNLRRVGNFTPKKLDFGTIAGDANVGVAASLGLRLCDVFDLAGYEAVGGPAIKASVTHHLDQKLTCTDLALYVQLKSQITKESLIGEVLSAVVKNEKKTAKVSYALEHEFWTKDSSPFKKRAHFENGVKVPKCTYGEGNLAGIVISAEAKEPISKARVELRNVIGEKVKTVYTNPDGKYGFNDVGAGNYTLYISATRRQKYQNNVTVKKGETTQVDVGLSVLRGPAGESGTLAILASDATTGNGLSGVTYNIRRGFNVRDGEIIIEGTMTSSSEYVDLATGNYTIEAIKEGYASTFMNVAVTNGTVTNVQMVMSPGNGEAIGIGALRVVLTWGASPSDLDSHLYAPDNKYHIFYRQKEYYDENGHLCANLDVDDTTSFGPETTTVLLPEDGVYQFFVHDYSNRYKTDSKEMSNSSAKIVVYINNVEKATYNIPADQVGNVWYVFNYDSVNGNINGINQIYNHTDPTDINKNTQGYTNAA